MKNMRIFVLSAFLFTFVLINSAYADAATLEGGITQAPKYMAADQPFVIEFKIGGMQPGANYYIKPRFYQTQGSYLGNAYNFEPGKWLKQSDSWTSYPVFSSDSEGSAEGRLVVKLQQTETEDFQLQLVTRKAGGSVNDTVPEEVTIQTLDISSEGNGGYLTGIVTGGANANAQIFNMQKELLAYYLTEDNGVMDGFAEEPGYFKLPVPANTDIFFSAKTDAGDMYISDITNLLPGDEKIIDAGLLEPLDIVISAPQENSVMSFKNQDYLSVDWNINGGLPPFTVDVKLKNMETEEYIFEKEFEAQETSGNLLIPAFGLNGSMILEVSVTDWLGNADFREIEFIADSTPPVEPNILSNFKFVNKDRSKTRKIVGKAEPLTEVTLILEDSKGSSITESISANIDGVFQKNFDMTSLKDGIIHLSVFCRDKAGNISKTSKARFVLDTKPPIILIKRMAKQKDFLIVKFLVKDSSPKLKLSVFAKIFSGTMKKLYYKEISKGKEYRIKVKIPEKNKSFEFRAVDRAGNKSVVNRFVLKTSPKKMLALK